MKLEMKEGEGGWVVGDEDGVSSTFPTSESYMHLYFVKWSSAVLNCFNFKDPHNSESVWNERDP